MSESYFRNQWREFWNPCLEHEVSSCASSCCLLWRLRTRLTRINGITPTIVIKIIKLIICQRQNAPWCFRFNLGQRSERGISIKKSIGEFEFTRILAYQSKYLRVFILGIKRCKDFLTLGSSTWSHTYSFYACPWNIYLCNYFSSQWERDELA